MKSSKYLSEAEFHMILAAQRLTISPGSTFALYLDRGFENINDMLVPLVWFEESAMLTEETADKFKSKYRDPIRRVNTILFSLLIGSILLFAVNLRLLAANNFGKNVYKWRPGKSEKSEKSTAQIENPNPAMKQRESNSGLTQIPLPELLVSEKPISKVARKSSPLLTKSTQATGETLAASKGAISERLTRNGKDLKENQLAELEKLQRQGP